MQDFNWLSDSSSVHGYCRHQVLNLIAMDFVSLHVIPLKLFYWQTFFELGVMNIHDMNIKKCNKKFGAPGLFTHQQVLKMGVFLLVAH